MRIGLATMFAWRPHVEHLMYLAGLLEDAGHETRFLTCDAQLPTCYNLKMKGQGRLLGCATCILGGVRSYRPSGEVRSLNTDRRAGLPEEKLHAMAASSSYTLVRSETASGARIGRAKRIQEELAEPIDIMVQNTVDWIEEQRLDGVIVFNGRVDATRGILAGCRKIGVPFLSMERREHGIQLIPNADCLSLAEIHRISRAFRDRPLTGPQAEHAASDAARRLLQRGLKDWRQYNVNSEDARWPDTSGVGPRVLILPSSKNEFEGHPDWSTEWSDYTVPFGRILDRLGVDPGHCVLRGHPNWAEKIGRTETAESDEHYSAWARRWGIHYIGSEERARTQDLMREADIIVLNGSSAAYEAGILGKTILCVGHARYEHSGFVTPVRTSAEIDALDVPRAEDEESVIRHTLRSIYASTRRIPQFVDEVRAVATLEFKYLEGGDAGPIIRMLQSGSIDPYDPSFAEDERAETGVVERVASCDWETVLGWAEGRTPDRSEVTVGRRFAFRWLDEVRPLFRRGDR